MVAKCAIGSAAVIMSNHRLVFLAAAVFAAASAIGAVPTPATAKEPAVYAGIVKGVAVGGYDPVAYFTAKKPTPGKAEFTHEHDGAMWRFASAANRDAFKAEPGKYAPQYGGYCAWAVSQGYTAKGDPNAWSVVGDKLYLNYNTAVQLGWEVSKAANIKKGDANWPTVLDKPTK
jgi:YHS domain-containing protein